MLEQELSPSEVPLALLPVRLETRFVRNESANAMELRIRVYPDKIHIDSHETLLTVAERDWGRHFWEQCWRAGGVAGAEARAWRQLAERYGAGRAGWIARQLRPTNPDARPQMPVPADTPLAPPPAFPDPPTAPPGDDAAWRRAPEARLLPDRWIAVAYHNGQVALVASGREIVPSLAAGPDPSPQADVPTVTDDTLAIDNGMRWMIDFAEAEARGMALRMTLTPIQVAVGIQSLIVFGVRGTLPPADGAARFAALLDAHHYTDGLEFLRFGAPTNNTTELRSAYSSVDTSEARSYSSEVGQGAAAAALPASNARELGAALGLDVAVVPDVLGRIPGAGDSLKLDAANMNTALWPVTWGYYLSNLIGFDGTGLSVELLAWARRHYIDYVRGSGPLPAFRCGRQPYGLLPTTSLELWQPPAGEEVAHAPLTWLRTPLLRLRDNIWRGALREVPRLGSPADPHAALSQVMRTEALSSRYEMRSMLGRHYVQHLRAFIVEDLANNGWIPTQEAAASGILQRMNFGWRPRLHRSVYGDLSHRLRAPLVQAGEVSSTKLLEPNYIGALLAETSIDAIAANHVQGVEGGTLLHALLRHGLLLEYAGAAAAILATTGTAMAVLLRDAELVDLVGGAPPTLTWRRQLDQRVTAITGNKTIREHLQGADGLQGSAAAALREYRAALARLQGRDSETLQYLMQTTLDLASHRLDAWATSYATQRLAAMRATRPTGLVVGAYGWVEDVHGRGFGTPVELPPDEPAPLFAPLGDTGFIHAPSTAQAATAALLRNAHLGVDGMAEADGPLAIDLSSRRLRTARWLLDGVRRGQPLGALLGYRFERRLHDDNLDVEIARFRRIAPLVADKLAATDLPAETIAAGNVVDGLRLAQWWALNRDSGDSASFSAKLKAALDDLSATIDAVGDGLTAESAYQAVRGNISRVAGSLAALTKGEGAIPELDLARTPRTGTLLTHRVVLLFAGVQPATPGWPAAGASQRARAEPMLNAWAARLIGDPRTIRCIVERLDEAGDTVLQTIELPLAELGLAPLDVVYGVAASARAGQASALEERLLYHVRQRPGGVGDTARLRVRSARRAGAAASELFLSDAIEQARALRQLFGGARPLDAVDLDLPERAAAGTLDLASVEARVEEAEAALSELRDAAAAELNQTTATNADALRTLILRCDGFGFAAAIPASASGDDDATRDGLRRQLSLLAGTLEARAQQAKALAAQRPPPSDALDSTFALRRHLAARFENTFGAGFVALPAFTCGHADELATALSESTAVQAGDPLAVATWFERCKRVREPVARLATALTGAEVMGTGEGLSLRVAQLPRIAEARWVGLPATANKPILHGRVSLVIQSAATLTPDAMRTATLSGLMIDEWVETVPNKLETTAITFQTDPPNACAPQAVLLAVPPVPGKPWTGETLVRVLFETLEWTKLRAIDAEALGELGHYLPALHFGFNVAGDAVSTDFKPLS